MLLENNPKTLKIWQVFVRELRIPIYALAHDNLLLYSRNLLQEFRDEQREFLPHVGEQVDDAFAPHAFLQQCVDALVDGPLSGKMVPVIPLDVRPVITRVPELLQQIDHRILIILFTATPGRRLVWFVLIYL